MFGTTAISFSDKDSTGITPSPIWVPKDGCKGRFSCYRTESHVIVERAAIALSIEAKSDLTSRGDSHPKRLRSLSRTTVGINTHDVYNTYDIYSGKISIPRAMEVSIVRRSMPRPSDGVTYSPKTITIRSDQVEFLKKNSISLSRFVQQKIDEMMDGKKERA